MKAFIHSGDIVLVKKQATANNGQKVVALVDNHEATLKKFYKEGSSIRLQPAHKNMEPLIFRNGRDISVQGIVLGVIRDGGSSFSPKNFLQRNTAKLDVYKGVPYFGADNLLIYKDDILTVSSIPNNSIDLIITSPPYNVDIHYNSHVDNLSYDEYLEFTRKWIKKCFDLANVRGDFC